jgi:hypothetical protein
MSDAIKGPAGLALSGAKGTKVARTRDAFLGWFEEVSLVMFRMNVGGDNFLVVSDGNENRKPSALPSHPMRASLEQRGGTKKRCVSYLIQLILAAFWVVDGRLVAVVAQVARCDKTIAP